MSLKYNNPWVSLCIIGLLYITQSLCFTLFLQRTRQRSIVSTVRSSIEIQDSRHKQWRDIQVIESLITQQYIQPKSKLDLLSPTDIEFISLIVEERAQARTRGDYVLADEIRLYLEALCSPIPSHNNNNNNNRSSSIHPILLKHTCTNTTLVERWPLGYQLAINDVPRSLGGGSNWEIVPIHTRYEDDVDDDYIQLDPTQTKKQSVLSLAHQALGLAISSSRKNIAMHPQELKNIVLSTKQRIVESGLEDLRGRKAADAAFWFALAGVTDEEDCITYRQQESLGNELNYDDLNFSLFTALTCFCIHELQRFGKRSSCDVKYIVQMVERFAVAGIQGPVADKLWTVAAECMDSKKQSSACTLLLNTTLGHGYPSIPSKESNKNELLLQTLESSGMIQSLRDASFNLHSPRSLLWIWRFASRQRKQKAFLDTALKHWEIQETVQDKVVQGSHDHNISQEEQTLMDTLFFQNSIDWFDFFEDPTRPLVVDIGCGMGVSLLGLSQISSPSEFTIKQHSSSFNINIDWSQCNYLGGDLSRLAIGYATAIAKRWGIHRTRVYFVVDDAESMMQKIQDSYPGPIVLTMINFPTPFRIQSYLNRTENVSEDFSVRPSSINSLDAREKARGNSQLPDNSHSGFMVTSKLLTHIRAALSKKSMVSTYSESVDIRGNRYLVMQSNCEDVAVYMKNLVSEQGFDLIPMDKTNGSNECSNEINSRIPKRTMEWIRLRGERATGPWFSQNPLFPGRGATETEIACIEKNTPIYRFIATIQ